MNGLELQDILLTFPEGGRRRTVLDIPYLKVTSGEHIGIRGASGSGKSSLLNVVSGLVLPDRGTVRWGATVPGALPEHERDRWRGQHIGFVFQDFQLLTDRSVHKNLEFVLKATGWKKKSEIKERIDNVLRQVGMQDKGYKMPHELSGGEQQRIVIARALLNNPKLILADEPTGNLDPETSGQIVQLLHDICQQGTAVIMTTHNYTIVHNYPARIVKCENACLSDVRE